jgi:hypothetical protein
MKYVILAFALLACGPAKEVVQVVNGKDGLNGADGQDGAQGEQGIPGATGTNGTDGVDGQDGAQGPQGVAGADGSGATITVYSGNGCVLISGSSLYALIQNNSVSLHTNNTCVNNTKVVELSEGESYMVSANQLAVYSGGKLQVIKF